MNHDFLEGLTVKDEYLARVLRGEEYLLFDGGMGTILQAQGLEAGRMPDLLNVEEPERISAILKAYVDAGAQVVTTNTFTSNAHKLNGVAKVSDVFHAAVSCARASGARYVAANIGPTGSLLKPMGTLSFDEAYELFREQVVAAEAAGADLISLETMADLLETKAAVLAAKENTSLPVFACMTFGEDGRTFLGASPEAATVMLTGLGVHAIGVNCSLGPKELLPIVKTIACHTPRPVMVRPNAGLPQMVDGKTAYTVTPDDFRDAIAEMLESGINIIAGCCGTTAAYIEKLASLLQGKHPIKRDIPAFFSVTSSQHAVVLAAEKSEIAVIGERINPTGKPRLQEALRQGDYDYLIGEAIAQQEAGANILDVNVGLPDIDETATLVQTIERLQAVSALPLQIDSSDPVAIGAAARAYAGKPLINSVNGKDESLRAILPLVKRYGCAVVGLTLDERGIPATAQERCAIAEKIVAATDSYGIPRCDVVIDCLVMAASTNQNEVLEILRSITLVKARLGVKTVLGVSNISFGLPRRELVNATFLAAAFGAGLDMPILNPLSCFYQDVVNSFLVLNGQDVNAEAFIGEYAKRSDSYQAICSGGLPQQTGGGDLGDVDALDRDGKPLDLAAHVKHLILTGRKAQMEAATMQLLADREPMEVINGIFIPVLDEVGNKFDKGEFFLPQLMASAEAVKKGFDVVRAHSVDHAVEEKGAVCIATVKDDIHDIGKNIVKMLLENYGYCVYDLGRDVSPAAVVEAVKEHDVKLVGLSALMTTTVRAMAETIELLHNEVPDCKVFVGGAVLNPEYAEMVGADFYGKDAAEAARIVGRFFA
ncbi:MAG: homocysteine S-methyltransferase family protein [Raoultibacter sp.]